MPDSQSDVIISRDVLVREMQSILDFLLEQASAGKRMRLSDARSHLTGKLTLDFADYFKFLKRYNYVVISRSDHGLAVTEEGRALSDEAQGDAFEQELKQHFGSQMRDDHELIEIEDESFPLSDPEPESEQEPDVEPESEPARQDRRASPSRSKDESSPAPKGIKFDSKYTRYETIGSGGIGTVYRGRLSSLSLDVAIKEIKELFSYFNFLQRSEVIRHLRDVVGQMSLLQHPLIVKILDQNTDVAHPYFVTEYLPGGNLKEQMADSVVEIDRCLTLFTQICYALRTAHQSDVIHGNLKPENILLDAQGNVRVTDFGMTRLLQTDSDRPVPRVVTGSIGYLSPEQMGDATSASVKSDIYSLGIMLYEMLTGNLPGRRSPLPSEVSKKVPASLDELFDRMTRDDPSERYPDIDSLLDAFYKSVGDDRLLSKGRIVLFAVADEAAKTEETEGSDHDGEPGGDENKKKMKKK